MFRGAAIARAVSAFVLLACAAFVDACVPAVNLDLPDDPQAKSMLVAITSDPSAPPIVIIYDPSDRFLAGTLPRGDPLIEVLSFPWTLEELQIASGRLAALEPGDPASRSLPPPSMINARMISEPEWRVVSEPSAPVKVLRLPALDVQRCANAGGCIESRTAIDHCAIPCPPQNEEPAPPVSPEPPRIVLAPCPLGETGVVIDGERDPVCAPPPRLDLPCPSGQYQLFGDPACSRISTCPSGQFAEELPRAASEVVQVHAGEDVSAALANAGEGAIVLLSSGLHHGPLTISKAGQVLWGKCPEETEIDGQIFIGAADTMIGNVTLLSDDDNVVVTASTSVRVERAQIHATGTVAVVSNHASVDLDRVSITGGSVWSTSFQNTSDARLRDVVMENVPSVGAYITAGTHVELTRVVMHSDPSSGLVGVIAANPGTRVDSFELAIDGTRSDSVQISDSASARFERLFVKSSTRSEGAPGQGVSVNRATVELYGAIIDGAGNAGIVASTSSLAVGWSVVRNTHRFWPTSGIGIALLRARSADIFAVVIEHSVSTGILIQENQVAVTIRDTIIRDTKEDAESLLGSGVGLEIGRAKLDRLLIEGSAYCAIIGNDDSRIEARDIDARGIRLARFINGSPSAAIKLETSTATVFERVAVRDAAGDGVHTDDSRLVATDLLVDGAGGFGLKIYDPFAASFTRTQISNTHGGACFDDSTLYLRQRASVRDLAIEKTASSTVACGGVGLCLSTFAEMSATKVRIHDSALAGVSVGETAMLDLSDASILGGVVGLCFDGELDRTSMLERVEFLGQRVAVSDVCTMEPAP